MPTAPVPVYLIILNPEVVFVCRENPGLSPLSATLVTDPPFAAQEKTTISLLLPFTEGSVSTVNPSESKESSLVVVLL